MKETNCIYKEYLRLKEIEEDRNDYYAALDVKNKNKKWKSHKSYLEQLEHIGIHVQQAFLFGSYASGKHDKWSDIDLAIVSKDFIGNRFEARNKIRKITLQVNSDISPMPYRPEDFNDSDYFVKEILETGIRIV
jgi:predicted nucleotidyltransferase